MLVQTSDAGVITETDLKVVTEVEPDPAQVRDMLFAWKVANFGKGNGIVFWKEGMTVGVGG